MAQILEMEVSNPNIYQVGPTGFEAKFEQILVLEDPFRSGYECVTCDAAGRIPCGECENGSSRVNPDIRCKECHGERSIVCPECEGKKESIVIPDKAKARPTSGTIVSIGTKAREFKMGDKVLYPSFRGEVLDLKAVDTAGIEQEVILRFLKETEVICQLHGDYLNLRRRMKRQTELGE